MTDTNKPITKFLEFVMVISVVNVDDLSNAMPVCILGIRCSDKKRMEIAFAVSKEDATTYVDSIRDDMDSENIKSIENAIAVDTTLPAKRTDSCTRPGLQIVSGEGAMAIYLFFQATMIAQQQKTFSQPNPSQFGGSDPQGGKLN